MRQTALAGGARKANLDGFDDARGAVRGHHEIARRADHMLCCIALAGVLPHLFKPGDRPRPDRIVVHDRRHGILRSGNAWGAKGCLFQLLSHREMLLEMGQRARRPLLQVGIVSVFGIGFK
jgi:hypothetical protein